MSTVLKPLDSESVEVLHGICLGTYLDGQCYEFAIALHRKLGLPMVGLIDGGTIRHALLRHTDGSLRDVRGVVSLLEVGKPFGIQQPYNLRDISEADILKVRPVRENGIDTAIHLAELIWPDLQWNGEAKKVTAFVEELEVLSRKHGIWIRAAYPTAMPVLSEAFGEELGYTITPTANAGGYLLDRRLS